MANTLDKRLAALSKSKVELEESDSVEMKRLNTHLRRDLHRQLGLRSVEGLGTRTDQVNEAIAIYLSIFEGYCSLTPEQRRAIKRKLDD